MTKKKFLFAALGVVLACACIFTTCEMAGSKQETIDAAEPVFSDDLLIYYTGKPNDDITLLVTAEAPDGGSISYQWYRVDGDTPVPLSEETFYDYKFTPTAEGVYYFYVVAINTNENVNGEKTASSNSTVTTVYIDDEASTVTFPIITRQPSDDTKEIDDDAELSVEVNPVEGGDLTYQWYRNATVSNKNGTLITGATGAAYSQKMTSAGTFYFYVVITNTVEDKTKTTASQPATITVRAEGPNATVILSTRKKQYVRGYGGMGDNSFSADPIMEKLDEYETLFNPDTGLGLNMLRIMIMPENPVDNTDVRETNKYYVEGNGNLPLYYEGVKIVNKYNGYVLASPWSPPPEWKSNNSKNGGGSLVHSFYGQYAQYLRDYCQDMLDHGAPIYAVSIQNEPNFMASYDGCEWSNEEMRDFFVEQGHFTTIPSAIKGWGGGRETPFVLTMNGESANNPAINDPAMDNATSRAAIDVLGRHIYGDVQVRYAKALDKEPKREVWMTEHNINSGQAPAYPNDSTWNYVWQFLNDVDVSIRLNDESAFIWWYIRRFYSAIGDGTYGTVKGVVYPRGYGLSQYAKFSKEMWRVDVLVSGTAADGTTELSPGRNVNNSTFDRNSIAAKVTGFMSDDGNTFSVVMWTPTSTNGAGGLDMGTVKIQLPQGFVARSATAMRTNASVKAKTEKVQLSGDGTYAYVMLPRSNILSVRFTR